MPLAVVGDGAAVCAAAAAPEAALIICNHRTRIDWMFLWCLAVRLRRADALLIALKRELAAAPAFGWAMQCFLFVFLSRRDRAAELPEPADPSRRVS